MYMSFTGKEESIVFTFERQKESGMKDVYVKFSDNTIVKNPTIGSTLWRLQFHETGVRVVLVQADQVELRKKLIEKVPQFDLLEALTPCGALTYPIGRATPSYASVSCEIEIKGQLDPEWLLSGNVIPLDSVDQSGTLYGFPVSVAAPKPKPKKAATSVKISPKAEPKGAVKDVTAKSETKFKSKPE